MLPVVAVVQEGEVLREEDQADEGHQEVCYSFEIPTCPVLNLFTLAGFSRGGFGGGGGGRGAPRGRGGPPGGGRGGFGGGFGGGGRGRGRGGY